MIQGTDYHPSDVDFSEGLIRVSGQMGRYIQILKLFKERKKDSFIEIEKALSNNDTRQTIYLLHTLKGAAASIGANFVSNQAGRIQKLLENGKPPSELREDLDLLMIAMNHLFPAIDFFIAQNEISAPCDVIDLDSLKIEVAELARKIAYRNVEAIEIFERISEQLSNQTDLKHAQLLRQLLYNLDWEKCSEVIADLTNVLKLL